MGYIMSGGLTEKQRRSAAAKKAWVTRTRRKAIARKTEQDGSWIWKEYRIHEGLDECFTQMESWKLPLNEKSIRRRLEECFPKVTDGIPFQIIPHLPREMKAPGCSRLLFILIKTNNFADRTLEALDVARTCKGKVEAILYITLSWAANLDQRFASIAKIFRDYGVASVCRREPVKASPPIYY